MKHDHYFSWQNNAVLMTDVFLFEAPLGILGRVFNRLILTRYLTHFLQERNRVIKEFAESGRWKTLPGF